MLRQWASRKQRNSYIYIYIIGVILSCIVAVSNTITVSAEKYKVVVNCGEYVTGGRSEFNIKDKRVNPPPGCNCNINKNSFNSDLRYITGCKPDNGDPSDWSLEIELDGSQSTLYTDADGKSLSADHTQSVVIPGRAKDDEVKKRCEQKYTSADEQKKCIQAADCISKITFHSDTQYEGQTRQCVVGAGLKADDVDAISDINSAGIAASNEAQKADDAEETPCETSSEEFAWLVCPAIDKASNTAEDIFSNQLYNAFSYDITANSELKDAWQSFLPLGNIVLAIVFLIMIYSLATSSGMSNYTIKKVLPRLIVAAIAINLSFYICALAVDLSNIIGANIKDFLKPSADPLSWLEKFGTGAVTTVALVFLIASSLSVVIIGGLLLLALIALRSTLLTIMIIISPIAFALYLLPNTKKWFDMYVKEFSRLLIAYPLVSAVWGAAMLTEGILDANTSGFSLMNTIITPLLVLAPVVAVLPILKMSGNIMSLAGNKLNGIGESGRNKYRNTDYAQKRQEARKAMLARTNGRIANKLASSRFGNAAAFVAGAGAGGSKTGRRILQGYTNKAVSLEAAADAEDLKSNTAAWKQRAIKDGMSPQDMLQAMESGSYKGRSLSDMDKRALINHGFESGSFSHPDDISRALDVAKDTNDVMVWDTARSGAVKAGFSPGYMYGQAGSKGANYNKSDAMSAWADQLTPATAVKANGKFAHAAIASGNRDKIMSTLSEMSDKQYQDIEDGETKKLASLARSSASSWMDSGSKGPTSVEDLASLSAGDYDTLKKVSSNFTDGSKDNTKINDQIKSVFNSAGIQDANQARALTRQVARADGTTKDVRVFNERQIDMFIQHGDIKASPYQYPSGGPGGFASSPRP